jgi:hypothetical protein
MFFFAFCGANWDNNFPFQQIVLEKKKKILVKIGRMDVQIVLCNFLSLSGQFSIRVISFFLRGRERKNQFALRSICLDGKTEKFAKSISI